jgi:YebC/PmpR family DNA-binding regulatory protein
VGAQWKHAGKVEGAAAKGAKVHKLAKEVQVASKMGGPDPTYNARLRAAVEAARKASVNKDTIERAIKKGDGLLDDGSTFENVVFEGFTPHKVPVIVECVTDNRNRTASEVKSLFRQGQLGAIGSVAWMFDKLGIIEATLNDKTKDIEEVAIEAGAQNVEAMHKSQIPEGHIGAVFYSDPADLDAVNKYLSGAGWVITQSEIGYLAKNNVELTSEQMKDVSEFLAELDELEDVHRIYTALK